MTIPLSPPPLPTFTPISQFNDHLYDLSKAYDSSVQIFADPSRPLDSPNRVLDPSNLFDLKDAWIKSLREKVVPHWEEWQEMARQQADNLVVRTLRKLNKHTAQFLQVPGRYFPKISDFASLPTPPKDPSYYELFLTCLDTIDTAYSDWLRLHVHDASQTAYDKAAKEAWKADVTCIVAVKWDSMSPHGRKLTVERLETTIQRLQNNRFPGPDYLASCPIL